MEPGRVRQGAEGRAEVVRHTGDFRAMILEQSLCQYVPVCPSVHPTLNGIVRETRPAPFGSGTRAFDSATIGRFVDDQRNPTGNAN